MDSFSPPHGQAWPGHPVFSAPSPGWPDRGLARRERESCSRPRQSLPGGDVEEVDLTPIIIEAYPLAGCGREAAWAAYHDFGIPRLAERGHQDDLGPQHLGRDRMSIDRLAAPRRKMEVLRPEADDHRLA